MGMLSGGSIETNLTQFLFTCRITLNTTTSQSPTELLFKHHPTSRLDVLFLNLASYVEQHQYLQSVMFNQNLITKSKVYNRSQNQTKV